MNLKTVIIAAAFTGIATGAFAEGYHPGYSTSDLIRAQKEASASETVIGTRGAAVTAVDGVKVYSPGYSSSDLRQAEKSANSSHTLPFNQGNAGTAFVDDPA